METELLACIAKINRDLLIFNINVLGNKCIFSTRSQGKTKDYFSTPITFVWYFKWEEPEIKHEMTFEIWKDKKWRLRSEHNTNEKYDFANPLKGEFIFDYSFETVSEMINATEKTKEEFLATLKERILL